MTAALIVFVSPAGAFLRARVTEWTSDTGGPRLILWRDSLSMGMTRAAIGSGLESFTQQFPRSQSARLSAAYPDFHHESPHNILLDIFTEQGVPGLAVFLMLLVAGGRLGLAAVRAQRPGALFAVGACVASLIAQQFSAFTAATYLMLMVSLVLAASLAPAKLEKPPATHPYTLRLLWLPVAVCLAGLTIRFCERDAKLQRIALLLKSVQVTQAVGDYRLIDQSELLGESPDLWFSRRVITSVPPKASEAIRHQAWQAAVDPATRAGSRSEERFNVYFHLAYLWSLADNSQMTEDNLRAAIDWAPGWYKPRWYLSKLLAAGGRKEEAVRQASLAKTLHGNRPLE